MKKIIIDTDPGIDDAIALCYALNHPDLDVLALTTIYGNVSVELATQNALRLCELNNSEAPVSQGTANPLQIKPNPVADFVHGKNGFGEIILPEPTTHASSRSSAETIVDLIHNHPKEVTLIAVGPLSNLALALQLSPEIATLTAEVVIMGGAFHCDGNISAYAEANIWGDPHAAQQVFKAAWPVTVHGLDVTYKVKFSNIYLDALAKNAKKTGGFLRDASQFYIEFYKRQHDFDGCCPHDQLALSYVTNPDWYTLETGILDVITDGAQIGRTTIEAMAESNKSIATDVNSQLLLNDYAAVLAHAG